MDGTTRAGGTSVHLCLAIFDGARTRWTGSGPSRRDERKALRRRQRTRVRGDGWAGARTSSHCAHAGFEGGRTSRQGAGARAVVRPLWYGPTFHQEAGAFTQGPIASPPTLSPPFMRWQSLAPSCRHGRGSIRPCCHACSVRLAAGIPGHIRAFATRLDGRGDQPHPAEDRQQENAFTKPAHTATCEARHGQQCQQRQDSEHERRNPNRGAL